MKPAFEGSGKGVSVRSLCQNAEPSWCEQVAKLLDTYAEPVLVETYLPGPSSPSRCSATATRRAACPSSAWTSTRCPTGAPPIYGYEAKWLWDSPSTRWRSSTARPGFPRRWPRTSRAAALAAYHALDCRDWCRIDVRCDAAGRPMVVELNPLPGILPDPRDNSCFPKAARAAGMSYDELIRTVADIAWRRISGRSLLAEVA